MVITFFIFTALALVIVPVSYVRLCQSMRKQGVPQPPILPFFFSFGTLGGFCVMLALSPSPVGLICFLPILASSLLSLIAALVLISQGKNHRYHKLAIRAGYLASIPFLLFAGAITVGLFCGTHR